MVADAAAGKSYDHSYISNWQKCFLGHKNRRLYRRVVFYPCSALLQQRKDSHKVTYLLELTRSYFTPQELLSWWENDRQLTRFATSFVKLCRLLGSKLKIPSNSMLWTQREREKWWNCSTVRNKDYRATSLLTQKARPCRDVAASVFNWNTLLCEPSIDSIAQNFVFFFYSH